MKIPCGRITGHGECCVEGRLCDQCHELRERLPLTDFEIDVLERALGIFRSEYDHEQSFPFNVVASLRDRLASLRGNSPRYPCEN